MSYVRLREPQKPGPEGDIDTEAGKGARWQRDGEMRSIICLASVGAVLTACVSAPVVTSPPPFPLALGGVYVTVREVEHQAAITDGLRNAGIPIAQGARDLSYMLKVDIGDIQNFSESCGYLRNVRYTLSYAVIPYARANRTEVEGPYGRSWTGQNVSIGGQAIEMVAKGYDGDCHPNVFDEMGTVLRQQMTGDVKVIDPEDRFFEKDPRFFEKLRTQWVHSAHASDSDIYFSNRRECMEESSVGPERAGSTRYDSERFDVCMKSLGWRPQ